MHTAWCPRIGNATYDPECAPFVADCGFPHADGACYEARCREGPGYASEAACESMGADHFWCGASGVLSLAPTAEATLAPSASCANPDAFLPDPVSCDSSSIYDNITAGIFDCARRRPSSR